MLKFLLSVVGLVASIYAVWILFIAIIHIAINRSSIIRKGGNKDEQDIFK